MKNKNERKFKLGKITIEDLKADLGKSEQNMIKGGETGACQTGITCAIIIC